MKKISILLQPFSNPKTIHGKAELANGNSLTIVFPPETTIAELYAAFEKEELAQ